MNPGVPIFGDRTLRVRQAQALRQNGYSWAQVARELGYATPRAAGIAVSRYLHRQRHPLVPRPAPEPVPPMGEDRSRGWRVRRAAQLRAAHWSWARVADELGYADEFVATACYCRARRRQATADERMEAAEVLRTAGWTWARVAGALGYANINSVQVSHRNWKRKQEAA